MQVGDTVTYQVGENTRTGKIVPRPDGEQFEGFYLVDDGIFYTADQLTVVEPATD